MDHTQALQLGAVEKYLLAELPPAVRDEFEEHFFDCPECATDLRATAAFMEAARMELAARPGLKSAPAKRPSAAARTRWQPLLVAGALAACLLLLIYQNAVIVPRYKTEIAQLQAPDVPPSISFVGGNSRGGTAMPQAAVRPGRPFLMQLDVPTQPRFASYTCKLYAPSGAMIWQVLVSSERAKDTVTISAPMHGVATGTYTLAVEGNTDANGSVGGPVLARYGFHLDIQS